MNSLGSESIWGLCVVPHFLLPAGKWRRKPSEISEANLLKLLSRKRPPDLIGVSYETVLHRFSPSVPMFASSAEASRRLAEKVKTGALAEGQSIGFFFRVVNLKEKKIKHAQDSWYMPLGTSGLLQKTGMGTQIELLQGLHLQRIFPGFQYRPVSEIQTPDNYPSKALRSALMRRGRKSFDYQPLSVDVAQMSLEVRKRLRLDSVWREIQRKNSLSRIPPRRRLR